MRSVVLGVCLFAAACSGRALIPQHLTNANLRPAVTAAQGALTSGQRPGLYGFPTRMKLAHRMGCSARVAVPDFVGTLTRPPRRS